jgi:hypothetical protein
MVHVMHVMCSQGPRKKKLKDLQRNQVEERQLQCIADSKKDEGKGNQKEEEPDPVTGPTFTDITQDIGYQSANIEAQTTITDEVFPCVSPLVCGHEQLKNSE